MSISERNIENIVGQSAGVRGWIVPQPVLMSSDTELWKITFLGEQFMAPQPQFLVKMMIPINFTLCTNALTSMFYCCNYIDSYPLVLPKETCWASFSFRNANIWQRHKRTNSSCSWKESESFVEHTVALFLWHAFRLAHFHHMCPKCLRSASLIFFFVVTNYKTN